MKIKTHTFGLGKFCIKESESGLLGCCDTPSIQKEMWILEGNTSKSLEVSVHEAMHAEGIPDRFLEIENNDSGKRIGNFLWRLGWRRKNK